MCGIAAILAIAYYAAIAWMLHGLVSPIAFPPPSELPLGAEYFQIGRSIAEGHGFSSPFHVRSGPTAWMPPALPVFIAGIYTLCGKNEFATAITFHLSGVLCVIATWLLVVRFAVRSNVHAVTVLIAFFMVLLTSWKDVFGATHDCPFLMLLTMLILTGFEHNMRVDRSTVEPDRAFAHRNRTILWGCLGGLSSLMSPSLLLTWLVCSLASLFRSKPRLLTVIAIALLIQAPWLIRNYVQFGVLVPIKSNSKYEAALAASTSTGVLQISTFDRHPYLDLEQARLHQSLGEQKYIQLRSLELRKQAEDQGNRYPQQVANRLLAYTVINTSSMANGLQKGIFCLPILLGLLYFVFERGPKQPMWSILFIFVCFGMPYIVISYYERYAMPVLPMRALGMAFGLQACLNWSTKSFGSRSSTGKLNDAS
jgi:4-amino-4-deoxy-L-arabinose transferase-like glycosyltransferase